jgi:AAA domain
VTPEAEAAAKVLAYSTSLAHLHPDPRLVLGAGAAIGAALWRLRPTTPSVRPSVPRAPFPPGRGPAPDAAADARGRTHGEGRAERVSMREEPPPKAWLVPDLVPYGPTPRRRLRMGLPPWEWERRGYVTTILGAGGVGKSYVLLDLALAALLGADWLGRPVQRVPTVLYVDTELDAEECSRRAYPLARGRGLPHPPRRLHYLHLGPSLASVEGRTLVAQVAAGVRAGLILVDSLTIGAYDVAASDQNGWNRVYTGMESWGVPVVAIDHLDKKASGAFGSFMKQAKVRSCLQLSLLSGGLLKVEHVKSNFGRKVEPFTVRASFGEEPGASTTFTVSLPSPAGTPPAAPPSPAPPGDEAPRPSSAPAPLPLPVMEPPAPPAPSAAHVLQERAHRALLPLLAGGGWVDTNTLMKALLDDGVCKRTAAYKLLAALAGAGLLERQGDPPLPARAYRLPPSSEDERTL